MKPIHRWCIAALCAVLLQNAGAADVPLPKAQIQAGVSYISGGIGVDEADAFRAAAAQYNLRVTFASTRGEYYASIKVTLSDDRGNTVIETTSDGPFVFFNVQPGTYTVTAENLGQSVKRVARVRSGHGAELYIRWPAVEQERTQ